MPVRPVSSASSRTAAACGVSPVSMPPPGRHHRCGFYGACSSRSCISSRPSASATASSADSGAVRRGPVPRAHERECEACRLVQVQLVEGRGIDERHLPPLPAHEVGVRHVEADGEELEPVLAAAGLAAEAAGPERLEPVGPDLEPGLLRQLPGGGGAEVLPVLEVPSGQAPSLRVVQRVLVALLHEDPAAAVDDGDGGEGVHGDDRTCPTWGMTGTPSSRHHGRMTTRGMRALQVGRGSVALTVLAATTAIVAGTAVALLGFVFPELGDDAAAADELRPSGVARVAWTFRSSPTGAGAGGAAPGGRRRRDGPRRLAHAPGGGAVRAAGRRPAARARRCRGGAARRDPLLGGRGADVCEADGRAGSTTRGPSTLRPRAAGVAAADHPVRVGAAAVVARRWCHAGCRESTAGSTSWRAAGIDNARAARRTDVRAGPPRRARPPCGSTAAWRRRAGRSGRPPRRPPGSRRP